MTLITHAFDALAKSEKEAFGAPDHPVLVVQHPIGTVKVEEVNKRADAAFDQAGGAFGRATERLDARTGVRFRVSGVGVTSFEVELKPDTRHLKPRRLNRETKWTQVHCILNE